MNTDQTETGLSPETIINMVLFVAFMAGGAWALSLGFKDSSTAIASSQWPTVQGTVTDSQLSSYEETSGDSSTTRYRANITYRYMVNGHPLIGSQVGFDDLDRTGQSEVEAIIARYPAGSAVTVYYDPARPQTAVLETGLTAGSLLPIGAGAALLVAGLVTGWQGIVRPRLMGGEG